jgi:hypothetical protein
MWKPTRVGEKDLIQAINPNSKNKQIDPSCTLL